MSLRKSGTVTFKFVVFFKSEKKTTRQAILDILLQNPEN